MMKSGLVMENGVLKICVFNYKTLDFTRLYEPHLIG